MTQRATGKDRNLHKYKIKSTAFQVKSCILLQNASSFLNETPQFSQVTIHWKPVLQISDGEYLCHWVPDICRLQHFLMEIYLTFKLASHSSSLNTILNHLIQIYHSEPFTAFPLPTWECKIVRAWLGCSAQTSSYSVIDSGYLQTGYHGAQPDLKLIM